MTEKRLREIIDANYNDVFFYYNGKKCGIDSSASNGVITFEMWYGDKLGLFNSFDSLLDDPFFDGKTIKELLKEIEIY